LHRGGKSYSIQREGRWDLEKLSQGDSAEGHRQRGKETLWEETTWRRDLEEASVNAYKEREAGGREA